MKIVMQILNSILCLIFGVMSIIDRINGQLTGAEFVIIIVLCNIWNLLGMIVYKKQLNNN